MSLVDRAVLNIYFLLARSIPIDMFFRLGCCRLGSRCRSWCWLDVVILRMAGIVHRSNLRFRRLR